MEPGVYNIVMYQGQDWKVTLNLVQSNNLPVNLTGGWLARMECRIAQDPTSALQFALSSVPAGGIGTITITPLSGTLTLVLPNAITSALTFTTAFYDLLLTDPLGNESPILTGTVTLTKRITTHTS